ncbi:MAG: DnaA regulatory inactivator Hda [Pseudohongiellaceae bacterium]
MKKTPQQLLLGIRLDAGSTAANFYVSDANAQLYHCLFDSEPREQFVYLWAGEPAGRTHLLQALCHRLHDTNGGERGARLDPREGAEGRAEEGGAIYIPLKEREHFTPAILEGIESLSLVCLDDIDSVAGDGDWERALFSTLNRARECQTTLVVTADSPPAGLPMQLADLRSRLQWGMVFQVHGPSDEDRKTILQLQAVSRGFELDDAVSDYILQRSDRSLTVLADVLKRLDTRSLQDKRRVTRPLVKDVMGW